uniref:Uncharacterized protein n=1 Tax=Peronospora matthiolae TaxID=2874970 RepID=A0AAV1TZN2_9STRA
MVKGRRKPEAEEERCTETQCFSLNSCSKGDTPGTRGWDSEVPASYEDDHIINTHPLQVMMMRPPALKRQQMRSVHKRRL